jgi:O-antigen/teichoic acid export membrane protein
MNHYIKQSLRPIIPPSLIKLMGQVSTVMVFNLVAYAARFAVTIFVARQWGPTVYGNIAVVMSLASLLFLPMAMGQHNVMYKYLPNATAKDRGPLMWTILFGNLVVVALVATLFWLGQSWIRNPLELSAGLWGLAMLLAVANNYQAISESFLRGQKRYSDIGFLKLLSTAASLTVVVALLLTNQVSISGFVFAFALGLFLFSVFAIWRSKPGPIHLKPELLKMAWPFGATILISQFSTALLFDGDLILLSSVLSADALGQYAAYFGLVKQLFFIFFVEIFCVVFLPTIASMDRRKLSSTLVRWTPVVFLVVVILSGSALWIILNLFGSQYVLKPLYLLICSVGISFFTLFQIDHHLLTMNGRSGAKVAMIPVLVLLPVFLYSIPMSATKFGLIGALCATASIYALMFLGIRFQVIRYFNQNNPKASS